MDKWIDGHQIFDGHHGSGRAESERTKVTDESYFWPYSKQVTPPILAP